MSGQFILVARVTGVHGIKGLVKLQCFIENLDLLTASPLLDKNGTPAFTVESTQIHGKAVLAKLSGIADRTAAEALKGREFYLPRAILPELDEGEAYYFDLPGCACLVQGEKIGEVAQVVNYGASDLLEIRRADKSLIYVPLAENFITAIDIKNRTVTIDPVPGLLD